MSFPDVHPEITLLIYSGKDVFILKGFVFSSTRMDSVSMRIICPLAKGRAGDVEVEGRRGDGMGDTEPRLSSHASLD